MQRTLFVTKASAAVVLLLMAGCENKQKDESSTSNPPTVIEPGKSVGNIRTGMKIDQVRADLGEPDRTTPNALEYTRLGFAVMPGPDGTVAVVMCGDVTGYNGPLVKRFTGRTKEGIGLGSTRDELIKAYGQPSNDEKFPGARESMKYDSLGITFSLEAAKVHHMIVRLGQTKSQPKSIDVVP